MKRPALFLFLCLTSCLALHAAPAVPESPRTTQFFAADSVDPKKLIPAPPAPDSLIQHAEIEMMVAIQAVRTPAQVALAEKVQSEDVFVFGSDVLGEWFNAANLPETAAFFAQIREELTPVGHATKKMFNRRRPPFQDARIKPCVEYSDTSSYPSGHAAQSALWAALLGAVYPEHAAAFADRAATTRWARVLGGAHHPTDVEAGRVIGEAEGVIMLKNPAVQKALAKLRTEAEPFLLKKAA